MKSEHGRKRIFIAGMIESVKSRKLPARLIFIIVGALSTVWFLIRVIPKPSRATYPCMKAAAPFMSGFIIYLLSLGSSALVLKKATKFLKQSRYLAFAAALAAGIILSFSTHLYNSRKAFASFEAKLEGPNQPMGTGVGINPGRVVWIHDPDATDESCTNSYGDYWSDDSNTDQEVVNRMLSDALQVLSGQTTDEDAWDAIFKYYNATHNKGDVGYTKGEKIVIKINLNTGSSTDSPFRTDYKTVDTSPQIVYAILDQLINHAGVDQSDIGIGDPGRTLDNLYWDKCAADFPNVHYWGTAAGRTPIEQSDETVFFTSDGTLEDWLPKCYLEAEYMINIPLLKKHHRAGISLTSKNHFGSFVPFSGSASHLHFSLPCPEGMADVSNGEYGEYRIFVDFIGHKDLGGKTILYLIDGLWGSTNWGHPPIRWRMAPFNNDWPSSIFASQDPVAIESVGFDFLRTEFDSDHPTEGSYDPSDNKGPFPQYDGVDDFMHQAASSENWPAGLIYDPEYDGTPLPESMGVHEHWNNATDKQYSRNLGESEGIELVYNNHSSSVISTDAIRTDGILTLYQNYPNPFHTITSITYRISAEASVRLSIYDNSGKIVQILQNGIQDAGEYSFHWDGSGSDGIRLETGIYFFAAEARTGSRVCRQSRKMVINSGS